MNTTNKVVCLGVVVLALGLRIASETTANFSYLLLAVYAFFGRSQAIQALALSWLLSMLNPGIAAFATAASIGHYTVLTSAAFSVLLRSHFFRSGKLYFKPLLIITLQLGLFIIIHSVLVSPVVDVSVLKAMSWMLAMTTQLAAWAALGFEEREQLSLDIFWGLIVVMLASIPLLFLPLGYLRNETGFQGVLAHPQVFGPTMALLGAWAISRMFSQNKPPWSSVALTIACLVLVVLSEARTAGIALILGVALAAFVGPTLSGRSVRAVLPGLYSKRLHLIAFFAIAGAIMAAPILSNTLGNYIMKRGDSSGLIEAYETSRGSLMNRMWNNIENKPFLGIGFGIASEPGSMKIERDPVLGLPTSASIEKGVLPLAVLEEVGIIGFIAVAVWVVCLLRQSSLGGVGPMAVSFTVLFLNMGEATLFSPAGMGMLPLLLLGWAFACGQQTKKT